MNRNFGKFILPSRLINDHPEIVFQILMMLEFIPTRCEHSYSRQSFIYEGLSPKFKKAEPNVMPFCYTLNPIIEQIEGESPRLISLDVVKTDYSSYQPITWRIVNEKS